MIARTAPELRIPLTSHDGAFTVVIETLGARIASIAHAPTGTEFLLCVPESDERPPRVSRDSSAEWHRRYAGGWHTLVPHAGDARTLDGVEHLFHGEAAWQHWRVIAQEDASCTLEIALSTVPLVVRRRVTVTRTGVRISQHITNLSERDVAFSWTEHPAFGSALIGPDTTLTIDDDPIDVRFPGTDDSHSGFLSVPVNGRGVVRLRNNAAGISLTLRWDPDLFPHLHVWQEHHYTTSFPWWGRVDTIALEPASRPYDADPDRLGPLVLARGATMTADFVLELTVQ